MTAYIRREALCLAHGWWAWRWANIALALLSLAVWGLPEEIVITLIAGSIRTLLGG